MVREGCECEREIVALNGAVDETHIILFAWLRNPGVPGKNATKIE